MLSAFGVRSWIATAVTLLGLLCMAAYTPGVKDIFLLRFWPSLLVFIPPFSLGILWSILYRKKDQLGPLGWGGVLLDEALLQFFFASLISFSNNPRGSWIFASFFLFTVGFHSYLMRVSLKYPFGAIGTALALLGAALLAPTREHLAIFAMIGPAGLAASLLLGTFAARHDRERRKQGQMRAAINAQILKEQTQRADTLSETLREVLGYNHDVNNTLMAAVLNTEMLIQLQKRFTTIPAERLQRPLQDLSSSLARVKQMIEEVRARGKDPTEETAEEAVEIYPVLDNVTAAISARFSQVRIVLSVDRTAPLRVRLRGGVLTLHRVLENLLTNACEGNGTESASHVEVITRKTRSGSRLEIVIRDNGPGFTEEQLKKPIEGFATTKPQGTGLGLYTCERLIAASHGNLSRANAPEGGALVSVLLPLG